MGIFRSSLISMWAGKSKSSQGQSPGAVLPELEEKADLVQQEPTVTVVNSPTDVKDAPPGSPRTRSKSPRIRSKSPRQRSKSPRKRDHWVPDHHTDGCSSCNRAFTFVNRRHHCRECGGLFCNACAPKRKPINRRICESC